jgi:hypothetical protein
LRGEQQKTLAEIMDKVCLCLKSLMEDEDGDDDWAVVWKSAHSIKGTTSYCYVDALDTYVATVGGLAMEDMEEVAQKGHIAESFEIQTAHEGKVCPSRPVYQARTLAAWDNSINIGVSALVW